jgi:hypothetical protein
MANMLAERGIPTKLLVQPTPRQNVTIGKSTKTCGGVDQGTQAPSVVNESYSEHIIDDDSASESGLELSGIFENQNKEEEDQIEIKEDDYKRKLTHGLYILAKDIESIIEAKKSSKR